MPRAVMAAVMLAGWRTAHLFLGLLFASFLDLARADCECGYTSTINNAGSYLFTDLIETDFLHLPNITTDTDWRRQSFNMTPAIGRGPYGMNYSILNVVSNPISSLDTWSGPGKLGLDPGLQLMVGGGVPANGYVQCAELDSAREDLLWGTYRTAMKLTMDPGTTAAFFWVCCSCSVSEMHTHGLYLVLQR